MKHLFCLFLFAAWSLCGMHAQHVFTLDTKKLGAEIQPTMYGIFFEDINFGADGGLYAELIENRSFEFPQRLMGWNTFGKVEVNDTHPAFERNPHYVTLSDAGHPERRSGLENRGFFGIGLKSGMEYHFSLYARSAGSAKIRIELVGSDNEIIARQSIEINGSTWNRYTATLTSTKTDAKGLLRLFLESKQSVDVDHISLFPGDAWQGVLRADLVNDLKELHPGVFRFPGGCIVEGTDLATRYQWKHSVGPAENRPLNINRWNDCFPYRLYPNYFQSYGLGFYEFFLLSEELGAQPLPILNVGMACQYQNLTNDLCHVAVDSLQPYIDDALDLIEFANGETSTPWGKLRADMGHPQPFNLKFIGIGNEQWGPLYAERLEPFIKAIRSRHPEIKIIGSSGPSPDDNDGKQFTYGWNEMKRLKADLVDEHYYRDPQWFLNNVTRYDRYDRKGPKVFAGEYACHIDVKASESPTARNCFEAALMEAAIMTGFERNADLVHMATYAPLFAHVEGWQWRPDLIWMDNLTTVRTPNYYVQQLYAQHRGTHVLKLTEEGKPITGQDGLCASAVYDQSNKRYIIKVVNTSDSPKEVTITFRGLKQVGAGEVIQLHAPQMEAFNTIQNKEQVIPQSTNIQVEGNELQTTIPAKSFMLYKF